MSALASTGRLCPVVVGRDRELDVLRGALTDARAGRGAAVCLLGEAGIGKSRLARELVALARGRDVVVAVGRAVPAGVGVPYRPWTEALSGLLRERAMPDDPRLRPWLAAVTAIVPPLGGNGAVEPGEVSAAVRGEALLRLLGHLASPAGLVVLLEDLHWADPDSLAVLEYVADNLAAVPVLVVATARDEPVTPALELADRLAARRSAVRLTLARLTADETAVMVQACLGADCTPGTAAAVARVAEGVPFLVEEVLASPGVPAGFAASVAARLAGLDPAEQRVVEAAAVLGRRFDWQLLGGTAQVSSSAVAAALERATAALLVTVDDGRFQFRHALTRDAVLARMLPPRRVELARRALAVLDGEGDEASEALRELAADLAEQAGDLGRATGLLLASGRAALARGAVDTALATLRRVVTTPTADGVRAQAARLLIEAAAAAGRVDEAVETASALLTALAASGAPPAQRAAVHVQVADAAVTATRWPLAADHLAEAARLLGSDPDPAVSAERAVLAAQVALEQEDLDRARALAQDVLADPATSPPVACQAWAVVGRTRRLDDLAGARVAFARALEVAEAAGLGVWEVRALHELATIDLLDRVDTALLLRTRARAEELGLLTRVAVADLQLSAAAASVCDLDEQTRRARCALDTATVLGLPQIQATALCELAEVHAIRDEPEELTAAVARALAIAPHDRELRGFCAGSRAMHALLYGDRAEAVELFVREADILRRGHTNPAAHRGILPLLLAVEADPRSGAAIAENRRAGLDRFFIHPGLLGLAEAVLAGRGGDRRRAEDLARKADGDLAAYPGWLHIAWLLTAPAAQADGWGTPRDWLRTAQDGFTRLGLPGPAQRCAQLMDAPGAEGWARFGLTAREAEVLAVVAEGLTNKEIAARLRLSPRTVEKHLEALLRKTATRSRTQLLALRLGGRTPDR